MEAAFSAEEGNRACGQQFADARQQRLCLSLLLNPALFFTLLQQQQQQQQQQQHQQHQQQQQQQQQQQFNWSSGPLLQPGSPLPSDIHSGPICSHALGGPP
ncbi:hypothetical protein Emed_003277 [Eimeria media]